MEKETKGLRPLNPSWAVLTQVVPPEAVGLTGRVHRHKAKVYAAPYQFPRDLEEALDDFAQTTLNLYMFLEFDPVVEAKAEAIKAQILRYVRGLEEKVHGKAEA